MLCMCIRIHSALLPSYCTSPMAVLMLELCSHNARGWVARFHSGGARCPLLLALLPGDTAALALILCTCGCRCLLV